MANGKKITVIGTVAAALLAITGAWLRWVGKKPVPTEGTHEVTSEWVYGILPGFHGLDLVTVLPPFLAAVVVLTSRDREWIFKSLPLAALPVLVMAGERFVTYQSDPTYVVKSGLYLTLASGVILLILGVGALWGSDASGKAPHV